MAGMMGDVHDGSASTVGDDHFHPVDSTHSKTSTITFDGVGIKRWLYDPPAAAMSHDNETITRTSHETVDGYEVMTATENDEDVDGLSEELEAEVMRLMGGQDTVLEAKLKSMSGKIRGILEDKLIERGVVGKQAQDIIEKKLQAILNKVRNGTGTPYLAVQEARLWGSNMEFSKKVRDHQAAESPMVEVEICDDETEEVQQHEQQMQLEKRLPLGDALAGITYRDLYYEEIAYDHNTRTGHGLGAKTDEYNKKRAKVNDLVDEHNFLMDQMPLEKARLEKKKLEYEMKAKEWEDMQKSFGRWPEEKEELLFQLDTLHDQLLEAEAENAKLHTLVESLQASVGKHQDALQILKTMPADIQEYYKKILQFSNEMAEANDKIEELKSTYWDFIGMVEKLTEALLKMEILPAVALFAAENYNKSFITGPWRGEGLKAGRVTAVQNKIANSVRMAKRLAVILERAKKNEKRVLKGLAF
jgi:hypothetical protein